MNDLIRPTLYDSFHRIWPVSPAAGIPAPPEDYEAEIPGTEPVDVVGPVCESGDFLARDYRMTMPEVGDLLAVETAGAYGFVMSSNYNSRPRSAEVLVVTTGQGSEVTFGLQDVDRQLRRWAEIHHLGERLNRSLASLDLAVTNNIPARWLQVNTGPVTAPKAPKALRAKRKNA